MTLNDQFGIWKEVALQIGVYLFLFLVASAFIGFVVWLAMRWR